MEVIWDPTKKECKKTRNLSIPAHTLGGSGAVMRNIRCGQAAPAIMRLKVRYHVDDAGSTVMEIFCQGKNPHNMLEWRILACTPQV